MKQFINLERKVLFEQENSDVNESFDKFLKSKKVTGLNIEVIGYRPCYPISYEELSPTFGILTIRYHLSDDKDVFCTTSEIAKKAMAMSKSDVPVWVGIIVTGEDEMPGIFNLLTHDEQMEELLKLAQEEV